MRLSPVCGHGEARAVARLVLEERFGLSLTDIAFGKVTDFTREETEERTSYLKKLQDTLNSAFLEGSKEQSAKQYREGPKNILDSVLDKIKNIHPIELRNLPEGSKNEILKQIERIEGKLEARKKACDDDLA